VKYLYTKESMGRLIKKGPIKKGMETFNQAIASGIFRNLGGSSEEMLWYSKYSFKFKC
jgi:hypothetical protein